MNESRRPLNPSSLFVEGFILGAVVGFVLAMWFTG